MEDSQLEHFQKMLDDMVAEYDRTVAQLDSLRAAGKIKTATFQQLTANKVMLQSMLDRYRRYGLL